MERHRDTEAERHRERERDGAMRWRNGETERQIDREIERKRNSKMESP